MTAALEVRGRQPAGKSLEERIRARVVPARGQVHVVTSQLARDVVGRQRTDCRIHSKRIGAARGRSARSGPGRGADRARRACRRPCADSQTSSTRSTRTFRPSSGSRSSGGWKIAGPPRSGSRRVAQLEPELEVLLEAEAGLEDRRVGELAVELGDPPIRSVVESAVRADWPVDAVHQPAVRASEAAEAAEVEVERVEEAGGRPAGDPVRLDVEPPVGSSPRAPAGTGGRLPREAARARGRARGRPAAPARRCGRPPCAHGARGPRPTRRAARGTVREIHATRK